MQGFGTSTNDVPACGRCGEPLVPGEPFCPGCGARVVALCRHCGDNVVPGEPFCPSCGTPRAGMDDAPTTSVALTAPPGGPTNPAWRSEVASMSGATSFRS